jgi:hypothetical protein
MKYLKREADARDSSGMEILFLVDGYDKTLKEPRESEEQCDAHV